MDPSLTSDCALIEQVLAAHAAIPYAYGQVETITVFDRERQQYVLMDVGWEGEQRVHGCLVHVAVRGGQIWIEYDGTEEGVATELVRAGLPKERIVLAFHPPAKRSLSGYAVA